MAVDLYKIDASQIGVGAAREKGKEHKGLIFFSNAPDPAIGAQCSNCHTIVWTDARANPVLAEQRPKQIPASGPRYKQYRKDKDTRFLHALPACPKCNANSFDRIVSNVEFPRFEDGSELGRGASDSDLSSVNPETISVWWLDE